MDSRLVSPYDPTTMLIISLFSLLGLYSTYRARPLARKVIVAFIGCLGGLSIMR